MEEDANPNSERVNEPPPPEPQQDVNKAPQPKAMPAGNGNVPPQQDAIILVVVVLVMTLTYQGLASPSSTFLKEGSSKIDWECISAEESFDLLKSFEECPAILAFMFLIFNTMIFLLSILIGYTTLQGLNLVPVRLLMVLLVLCYGVLLTAFYIQTAYFASFCGVVALLMLFLSYLKEEFKRIANNFANN